MLPEPINPALVKEAEQRAKTTQNRDERFLELTKHTLAEVRRRSKGSEQT